MTKGMEREYGNFDVFERGTYVENQTLIRNGCVITPIRLIDDGAVLIEGDTIVAVGHTRDFKACDHVQVIDADGAFVAPGFIETHVHGGGGGDVMSGNVEEVVTCARMHARGGVTAILPTTLTAPIDAIRRALDACEEAARLTYDGATIVGAHIEGPYLNIGKIGAQNPAYVKNPDLDEIIPVLDRYPFIRRVSVACELPGALELGQELRRRGIVASIAHTDATFHDVVRAVESGYTHATHMFNSMSSATKRGAYRVPGAVEAVMTLDGLTAELIADGHHIAPSMLQMVVRAKGLNQVCVTTDAMEAAGLGPGEYKLFGLDVIVEDSFAPEFELPERRGNYVAKLKDGTSFASSVATMDQVIRTLVELVGLSVCDAVSLATVLPARIHGLSRTRGMLRRECRPTWPSLMIRFGFKRRS